MRASARSRGGCVEHDASAPARHHSGYGPPDSRRVAPRRSGRGHGGATHSSTAGPKEPDRADVGRAATRRADQQAPRDLHNAPERSRLSRTAGAGPAGTRAPRRDHLCGEAPEGREETQALPPGTRRLPRAAGVPRARGGVHRPSVGARRAAYALSSSTPGGSVELTHTAQDRAIVAAQLGREPRGSWGVAARCHLGLPMVIENSPLAEGEPFPTLFWLTCPLLVKRASRLEGGGHMARVNDRLERGGGARGMNSGGGRAGPG